MVRKRDKQRRRATGRAPGGQGQAQMSGDATTVEETAVADSPKKRRTNPFEFIQQVRQETSKVTWPTRNEVIVTTIMVLIMVMIASLFFFVIDQILNFVVQFVLDSAS